MRLRNEFLLFLVVMAVLLPLEFWLIDYVFYIKYPSSNGRNLGPGG